MPSHSLRTLCLAALPLVTATPICGHLSLVRQGPESVDSPEHGDHMGAAMATGDFNGDGFDDLATGAPRENLQGGTNSQHGIVAVNFGSACGLTHEGAQMLQPHGADYSADIRFGDAIAAGDLNDDGYDDLLIGAWASRENGVTHAGRVYLWFGGPNGLGSFQIRTQSFWGLPQDSFDEFGFSVACGDINGDGVDDAVIGAPGDSGRIGTVCYAYGSPSGLSSPGSFRQSDVGEFSKPHESFGWSVAVGQFSDEGGTNPLDIVVTSPFEDVAGGLPLADVGMVSLVRMSPTGPAEGEHFRAQDFAGSVEVGSAFGLSLAAGDLGLSGAPFDDVVVGRPRKGSFRGDAFVLTGGDMTLTYNNTIDGSEFGTPAADFASFGGALAIGDFDHDGRNDLAVGSAGFAHPLDPSGGRVQVYRGVPGGLTVVDAWEYQATDLWDPEHEYSDLGTSLAFGAFDSTGRQNLAAGAPENEGAVFVVAPWRQPNGIGSRQAVMRDSGGNLRFTQRPFDPVYIADLAKLMTVLVLRERTKLPTNDPQHIPLDHVYTVPQSVAQTILTTYSFHSGEEVTVEELMRITLMLRARQGVVAIADLVAPNLGAFVAEMNAVAGSLGMASTAFFDEEGTSSFEESTAFDMEILGRAIASDPLLGAWSDTHTYQFVRTYPIQGQMQTQAQSISHHLTPGLASLVPQATGLMIGATTPAQQTGLFTASAAYYPFGKAVAATFGTSVGNSSLVADGANLLARGLSNCGIELEASQVGDSSIGPKECLDIEVWENEWITSEPPPDPEGPVTFVELQNLVQDGVDTHLTMDVVRKSIAELQHGEEVVYTTTGVSGHEGITLTNVDIPFLAAEVFTNEPGNPEYSVYLLQGQSFEITPNTASNNQFEMRMTSFSGSGSVAGLFVTENYSVDAWLGDGTTSPTSLGVRFDKSGRETELQFDIHLRGKDPAPGHFVALVLRGDDPNYTFDPKRADYERYGTGWPGGTGVPTLTVLEPPVQGETVDLLFGTSMASDTSGFWVIGLQPGALQTTLGGVLNVTPTQILPIALPKEGLALPWDVPPDLLLCGLSFYGQLLVVDPDTTDGFSFSRGLSLTLGS